MFSTTAAVEPQDGLPLRLPADNPMLPIKLGGSPSIQWIGLVNRRCQVGDCSGHPADITETAWYILECEFCDSELHNVTAEIGEWCRRAFALCQGENGPGLT